MSRPTPEFKATTDLPGIPFEDLRLMIRREVEEHDIAVLEDTATSLILDTKGGQFGIRLGDTGITEFMVATKDARELFSYKADAVEHIRTVFPNAAEAIRWSDGDVAGSLPPNFLFAKVQSVTPIGYSFLRVTFASNSFATYGEEAIHFRIVLPPKGVESEWPKVAPNGSVKWPKGPGAPHKPAYTARRVDYAANTMEMDVFVHNGGRMTDWAKGVMEGTDARNTIGLIGPAGGGLIRETGALIAADETGFPPVARFIEGLPEGASASVLLEAEEGEACGYPMPERKGVAVHWLARSMDESAADAVLERLEEHGNSVIWFAGERDDAKRVREAAKARGHDPKSLRVSAFWSRETDDIDGEEND